MSPVSQSAKPKTMTVAGVMSGTSGDGIDVAICRVSMGPDGVPRVKVLGHRSFAYPKLVRSAVLAAASGELLSAASFSRLSWRLGELYAKCIEKTAAELDVKLQLVACHGQTIFHGATAERFLGAPVRSTWQTGEAAVIAERLGVPVVSDLRAADLAAGGQGAPLVPMLDWCGFRHRTKNRLLLNLGGIANISVLPAGCDIDEVLAFDTGPANMVIDQLMQSYFDKPFDRHGAVAARGAMLPGVVDELLQSGYFAALPPKSCGREQYGAAFVAAFEKHCNGAPLEDRIATATSLTAASIVLAFSRFCLPHLAQRAAAARTTELFVAGGGAKNRTLMRMLQEQFGALNVRVASTASAGFAIEAKESAAFALLGWLTWHGLPGNVPSATGAQRRVVLGTITGRLVKQ